VLIEIRLFKKKAAKKGLATWWPEPPNEWNSISRSLVEPHLHLSSQVSKSSSVRWQPKEQVASGFVEYATDPSGFVAAAATDPGRVKFCTDSYVEFLRDSKRFAPNLVDAISGATALR